jgi:hypothetical protein
VLFQHLVEVTGGHIKHALLETADVVKKATEQARFAVATVKSFKATDFVYFCARA